MAIYDENLAAQFEAGQGWEDLSAGFISRGAYEELLDAKFIVRDSSSRSLFSEICVHTPRVGQDLNAWTEYDPQNELAHDCNDSWWQDMPRLREDTSLTKDVGAGGLGSDFFHELVLNVFAVDPTLNGAEERICAWAGSISLLNQNFYDLPANEVIALIVMATDTADQYQLMLIEKGGNFVILPVVWPNYQDRYIVIYKQGSSIVANVYQDAAHTILEDSGTIALSGDLNLRYISVPMSYGQLGAETSSGLVDPIFGSMENLPCAFIAQHSDSEELSAEFVVLQGSEDLPAAFEGQTSVDLLGEFIIRHEASEELLSGFRVRCSRRFGGNWQRKMWHVGAYYWRGRYCPTHDRLEFEYIAEKDLALNTWTENVNARINAAGFTGIDADLTVRGAGEGIPTTILYSDGVDVWIAESDETSVLGWAWDNLTKVFDGTPNDWYRKVNLGANRTTPIPRLWACAVFYDDLPDGKQWVKTSRQSTGGDITGWDAEVPVSNIANTDTIYGCSVRSMSDAGVAKNDMIFIYKENIAIRSRYYDGDWDDPIEDIDTTTLGGRAVWDLEHVETLAGDHMAHIVYVDADGSIQWKERDPGSAQVWSAASQLEAAFTDHFGVGIVEHGEGWSWVIWVHADIVEYRLHICDPETWWPPLANPSAVFDPSTDAVITTSTIEQPQTPDSIHAGEAVPICWVGQTAPGTPCGLGWGILRKAAEEDLLCTFIARHSTSRELEAGFDGQVSLNLPGEFFVINVGTVDLPAELVVAQWQEDLFGEFIVRRSTSLELHGGFDSQGALSLPAEFSIIRYYERILSAEFVVLQGSEDLLGEFISRLEAAQPLLGVFSIVHSIGLAAGFEVRHIDSAELLGVMSLRHSGTPLDLAAEFSVTNVDGNNLPCEFVVRHTFTGEGVIIAEDPWDLLNVKKGIGTGFLDDPMIGGPDAEHKVSGTASYRFRVGHQSDRHDYIVVGYAPETWMQHAKAEQLYSKYSLCPESVLKMLGKNWFVPSPAVNINLCTLNRETMTSTPTSAYSLATTPT